MAKWVLCQERSEKWPVGMTFFPGMVYAGRMAQAVGTDYEELIGVYGKNGRISFFLPARNFKLVSHYCLHQLDEDAFAANKLLAKFNSRIPRFLEYARSALDPSFAKKTNKELGDWYAKFNSDYWDAYVYSEPFAFAVQDSLSERLEAILRVRLKQAGEEDKFGEYFTLLAAMPQKAFASREEESLLRIAAKIEEDDELAAKFKKLGVEALAKELHGEPVNRAIEAHAQEFYWIPFDYAGEAWDYAHFIGVLKELIASQLDVRRRLNEIAEYYASLEVNQRKLEKRLSFTEKEIQLFAASRTLTWIMDWKKECFTKTHYCARSLLVEAAKRLSLPLELVYCVTPPELVSFLRGESKPDAAVLAERAQHCVLHGNGAHYRVFVGEEANAFLKAEGLVASSDAPVLEVKGVCASAGNALGEARVIEKASELSRLKKGDVLVTIMTSPDFVAGMKRAAAIVTNEGGVTCHAAIVARELGIPCVVGTGNATRVFKDGDLVEVRAQHGVARKIK